MCLHVHAKSVKKQVSESGITASELYKQVKAKETSGIKISKKEAKNIRVSCLSLSTNCQLYYLCFTAD